MTGQTKQIRPYVAKRDGIAQMANGLWHAWKKVDGRLYSGYGWNSHAALMDLDFHIQGGFHGQEDS